MGNFELGNKSRKKLKGVHPDLVRVVERAIEITKADFVVLEGLRTLERQKQLVAEKKSKTMNSRHITGHAVDLGPWPWNTDTDGDGKYNGEDKDSYVPIVNAMKQAAKELGISLVHGYDWGWDSPHHELDRKVYK